jgi:hypothetical protein
VELTVSIRINSDHFVAIGLASLTTLILSSVVILASTARAEEALIAPDFQLIAPENGPDLTLSSNEASANSEPYIMDDGPRQRDVVLAAPPEYNEPEVAQALIVRQQTASPDQNRTRTQDEIIMKRKVISEPVPY